jgi:hypothetical protein
MVFFMVSNFVRVCMYLCLSLLRCLYHSATARFCVLAYLFMYLFERIYLFFVATTTQERWGLYLLCVD